MAHLGFSPPTTGFPQSKSLEAKTGGWLGRSAAHERTARRRPCGRQPGRRWWETGGRGGGCSATGSQVGARLAARLRIRAAAGTRGPGLRGRRGVPAWPRPPGGRGLRTPQQGRRADGPAVRRSRSRGGSAFGMTRCGTPARSAAAVQVWNLNFLTSNPQFHVIT